MLSFLSCAGSNGSRFNELKELFFCLSFFVHFFVFSWFYDFFWSFLIVAVSSQFPLIVVQQDASQTSTGHVVESTGQVTEGWQRHVRSTGWT